MNCPFCQEPNALELVFNAGEQTTRCRRCRATLTGAIACSGFTATASARVAGVTVRSFSFEIAAETPKAEPPKALPAPAPKRPRKRRPPK